MPISLKCTCGSLLDFDDRFRGQTIPCPDCERPLLIADTRRPITSTCPFALASVVLSLVGAFTLVGSIAGGLCGLYSWRRLQTPPPGVGGRSFAKAGMLLGGLCTLLTAGLFTVMPTLGFDSLLRHFNYADDIRYPADLVLPPREDPLEVTLPNRNWGVLEKLNALGDNTNSELVLTNLREDAYAVRLSILSVWNQTTEEDILQKFLESEFLTKWLNRGRNPTYHIGENGLKPEKPQVNEETKERLFQSTLSAGGRDRTFLFRAFEMNGRMYVMAAGARKPRFSALEAELRQLVQSLKEAKTFKEAK